MSMLINAARFIAALVWTTVRSASINSGDSGAWSGFTLRMRYTAAGLADQAGTQMRVTLRAGNGEGLQISDGRAQLEGVGNYSFLSTPVQITWDGGSSGVTIPAGTTKVSDAFTIAYTGTAAIVFAFFMPSSTNDTFRYGGASNSSANFKSGNDTTTLTPVGYSSGGVLQDVFTLIEVQ